MIERRLFLPALGFAAASISRFADTLAHAQNFSAGIAPTGRLRAAINLGNSILAVKDRGTGEPRGVTVDLSRALAAKIGLPITLVEYRNAGAVVDSASKDEWDVAFLAVDSARTDVVVFTPSYMDVKNTFLVPAGSSIRTIADVDRSGVRIAVPARSAPDLFLARSLKHATLVRGDTESATFEMFAAGQAEAFAAARHSFATFTGGSAYRALDEPLLMVPHALAVPKGRVDALKLASLFIEEAKATGEIARAIARAGLDGVAVAPPAGIK